jgi:lipopolysaccharide transport system permease protein
MQSLAFKELYSHRELLLAWTSRTLRARYQQSILGGLWAIVQPVASVAVFTVIFTRFIPVDTGGVPYIVFSYVAMVPWTLFSTSLADMTDSLVGNMGLITKINFPREILPIAALFARLVDFAIAGSLLLLLMLAYQMPLYVAGLPVLAAILAVQLCLALGLGLAGAAMNVFFRDVKHLLALGLQVWLYATPIIYPVSAVPESLRTLYFLNPMAGVVESYRAVLLRGELPGPYLLISAAVSLIVLVAGYWFFRRIEYQFADVV